MTWCRKQEMKKRNQNEDEGKRNEPKHRKNEDNEDRPEGVAEISRNQSLFMSTLGYSLVGCNLRKAKKTLNSPEIRPSRSRL